MLKVLSNKIEFPPVDQASEDGLLAVGGDLSTDRLILAYKKGIFPWFEEGQPILWWSPDPRFVLFPEKLKISKSLNQFIRNNKFDITFNTAFDRVINECSKIKRPGQSGTWITKNMIYAYNELNKLGFTKSVEVWDKDDLVGGLYGVDVGNNIFCGESMFSKADNASKIAFVKFIQASNYQLIDCQVFTGHLERFGAENIPRLEFINIISHQKNSQNLKNY
jgi:leucyl/phenylalanyl-tRNA--protein transferase